MTGVGEGPGTTGEIAHLHPRREGARDVRRTRRRGGAIVRSPNLHVLPCPKEPQPPAARRALHLGALVAADPLYAVAEDGDEVLVLRDGHFEELHVVAFEGELAQLHVDLGLRRRRDLDPKPRGVPAGASGCIRLCILLRAPACTPDGSRRRLLLCRGGVPPFAAEAVHGGPCPIAQLGGGGLSIREEPHRRLHHVGRLLDVAAQKGERVV